MSHDDLLSRVPPEARAMIRNQSDPASLASTSAALPRKPYKVSLWVDGVPKGQPRPRAFARGGHAAVYDPGTAEGWKSQIAEAFRFHRPPTPIEGPVSVTLKFFFPRPGRLRKKKSPPGEIWHTAKPDVDNLAKSVFDALQQIGMFRDDSQIFECAISKVYATIGGKPGMEITIEEL